MELLLTVRGPGRDCRRSGRGRSRHAGRRAGRRARARGRRGCGRRRLGRTDRSPGRGVAPPSPKRRYGTATRSRSSAVPNRRLQNRAGRVLVARDRRTQRRRARVPVAARRAPDRARPACDIVLDDQASRRHVHLGVAATTSPSPTSAPPTAPSSTAGSSRDRRSSRGQLVEVGTTLLAVEVIDPPDGAGPRCPRPGPSTSTGRRGHPAAAVR